ncbi:hypothetical protein N7505_004038 [Penicillium chrysogenum]|jgi:hypothetical protein|uniref:Uncharacterized protein n=2 Tax=Penicillium chrysogenum TaxID=5076 RepID=A0ABQ8WSX8_PENCH|nr:hypothetical protein N7505_004038 [Penicillium chrysogenum]
MSGVNTYLLSPKFYFKRDGPITLGNLVLDPFRPHLVLTALDAVTRDTRYPKVETFTDFEQNLARSQGAGGSLSAWLEFLQSVNTKVGLAREKHRLDEYTMTSLETEYFLEFPSKEEIKSRIDSEHVRAAIKASGLFGTRNSVYMVTGRKLAKGFSALHASGKKNSGNVEAGASAHMLNGNVSVKAGAAGHKEMGLQAGWKANEELVFAYQLIKIDVKGLRGSKVLYDEFRHESAFLSHEGEVGHEEEEEESCGDIEVDVAAVTADDLAKLTDDNAILNIDLGEPSQKLSLVYTLN